MSAHHIRRAAPGDVAGIRRVARESWADVYEGLIPRDVQTRALEAWYSDASLRHSIEDAQSTFLVAVDADAVIGFLHIVGERLARIYVLPSAQRQGVGSRLLDTAGAGRLLVTVEADNEKGRRFYERSGFVARGRGTMDVFGHKVAVMEYERTPPAPPSSPSARR